MPRTSGAATRRTAPRRTTSRSSSARRAEPAGKVGRPKAAFLAPTASYMAYANDHNHLDGEKSEMLMGRLLVYQPDDLYLQEHRELGYSLYDATPTAAASAIPRGCGRS